MPPPVDEAAKEEKKAVKQKPPTEKDRTRQTRQRPYRPRMAEAAPDKAKPPEPRDKKPQSKPARRSLPWIRAALPLRAEVTPEPSAPRDATRRRKRGDRLSQPVRPAPVQKSSLWRPGRCRDAGTCGVGQGGGRQSARPRAVPVRMAAMRSSQATAASGQASLPDLRICRVSSAT